MMMVGWLRMRNVGVVGLLRERRLVVLI